MRTGGRGSEVSGRVPSWAVLDQFSVRWSASAASVVRVRVLRWVFRLLGVPCGAFGGEMFDGRTRWCVLPFGHSESHVWVFRTQPLAHERRFAQGWKHPQ